MLHKLGKNVPFPYIVLIRSWPGWPVARSKLYDDMDQDEDGKKGEITTMCKMSKETSRPDTQVGSYTINLSMQLA